MLRLLSVSAYFSYLRHMTAELNQWYVVITVVFTMKVQQAKQRLRGLKGLSLDQIDDTVTYYSRILTSLIFDFQTTRENVR